MILLFNIVPLLVVFTGVNGYAESLSKQDLVSNILTLEDQLAHQRSKRNAQLPDDRQQLPLKPDLIRGKNRYYDEIKLVHEDPDTFFKYWINVEELLNSTASNKKIYGSMNHTRLSNSYRRAARYELKNFVFPFYGHPTLNLTIATGGFLYMGTTMHSWLAATQYIAPLMANFDTSQSKDDNVLYAETEDYVVVEWKEVTLRGQSAAGNFTFQAKLEKNGDIYFLYKNVPMPVTEISDQFHPVKVGVSDAYLTKIPLFRATKTIIYEYHRVEVNFSNVSNYTVIHIKAQPTCFQLKTCSECLTANLPNFNCTWCDTSNGPGLKVPSYCSDMTGTHRLGQAWFNNHCDKQDNQGVYCPATEGAKEMDKSPTMIDVLLEIRRPLRLITRVITEDHLMEGSGELKG